MNKIARRAYQRVREDEYTDELDNARLFEAWKPIIRKLGLPGQCDVRDMASKLGQLGLLVVAQLAVGGESEKVRARCGKELAYMGGLKPVDRSASLDVHVMAEAEVDSLLRSKILELGILENGNHGLSRASVCLPSTEERDIEAAVGEREDPETEKARKLQASQRNMEKCSK